MIDFRERMKKLPLYGGEKELWSIFQVKGAKAFGGLNSLKAKSRTIFGAILGIHFGNY